jgi:hypothetical protein
MHHAAIRQSIVVVGAFMVGCITAVLAKSAMQLAIIILLIGSVGGGAAAALIARRWQTLVGIIPGLSASLWLVVFAYRDAHMYRGVSLSAYAQTHWREMLGALFVLLLPSLIVSFVIHALTPPDAPIAGNDSGPTV